MKCPVCTHENTRKFCIAENKDYYRCNTCRATFLHPAFYLSEKQEFAHYQHHENDVNDIHYRAFLQKIAEPLLTRLKPQSYGLDYGCGPGPALATMLREKGHSVDLFDPFFYPQKPHPTTLYDFLACSETVEHFHRPALEFEIFSGLLKAGGWLAIMTCFQSNDDKFKSWHYRRDPTHVVFYHHDTFVWIAQKLQFSCEFPKKNVVLMQKLV